MVGVLIDVFFTLRKSKSDGAAGVNASERSGVVGSKGGQSVTCEPCDARSLSAGPAKKVGCELSCP